MYAGIFSEILFVFMTPVVPMDVAGRVALAAVIMAVVIMMLARYVSRAGRN
jgi:hypothetical protein